MKISKIFLCFVVCWLAFLSAYAVEDSTKIYVQQVLVPAKPEERSSAIERLLALLQPSSFPFLEAINSSNLYMYGDVIVTLGNKKSDSGNDFDVFEIFPVYKQLQDKNGSPLSLTTDKLKPVDISRGDRLQLAPISGWLDIFNPDAQKRAMAYPQLQHANDTTLAKALSYALATETDADAMRAAKESYYAIKLSTSTEPTAAKTFMDSLSTNQGDDATGLLRTYAKKNGVPQELSAYASQKADGLDSHYAWLQRFQNLFSGLSLGSILILVSLGLAIVYGLAGIINMAHGEFLMIGAYATYSVQMLFNNVFHIQNPDWFYLAALPLSFAVAGVAGLLLERLVIRRLYAKPLESLLATWGVSLILIQLARSLFGDLTAVKLPPMLSGGWQITAHLVLPYSRLFIILLTVLVVIALYWVLFSTRLGMQIRAVTQNRNMSACLGINTKRVDAITFFIGSGLAGLAGCAMTLIGNVVPDMGQTYIVDSFLVVVTGGVGKLVGTISAGLGIGIFSKIFEAFFEAVYGKVLILLGIMIFMQFKPKGLFPDKGRMAED